MRKTLAITCENLNGKAQKGVIKFYGCDRPEDGNLDVVPLFILEKEEKAEGILL